MIVEGRERERDDARLCYPRLGVSVLPDGRVSDMNR